MSGLTPAADMKTVVVVGAGVMGEGIAQSFAEAGLHVRVVDTQPASLERCIKQIAENLELSASYGVISESPASVAARIVGVSGDGLGDALKTCEMAIETAPEVLEIKQSIFATLDTAPDHVLLASNTSSFTVSQLTAGLNAPERVVGLHYFNPAHLIPAVEIHRSDNTSALAIEIAGDIMRRTNKIPVIVRKEIAGFIINRLTGALSREIDHLLDEGVVSPDDLDDAIKASLGFRLAQLGPLEAKDFIGLDTDVRVSRNLYPQLSNRTEPSRLAKERVEAGHLGVKTGAGIFDYSGRTREQVLHERNLKLLEQRKLFLASRNAQANPKDKD